MTNPCGLTMASSLFPHPAPHRFRHESLKPLALLPLAPKRAQVGGFGKKESSKLVCVHFTLQFTYVHITLQFTEHLYSAPLGSTGRTSTSRVRKQTLRGDPQITCSLSAAHGASGEGGRGPQGRGQGLGSPGAPDSSSGGRPSGQKEVGNVQEDTG